MWYSSSDDEQAERPLYMAEARTSTGRSMPMPCRMLCNDGQREGAKLSPGLASGPFCYVPLHKIWYGSRQHEPYHRWE
jgi:hypothetical protein